MQAENHAQTLHAKQRSAAKLFKGIHTVPFEARLSESRKLRRTERTVTPAIEGRNRRERKPLVQSKVIREDSSPVAHVEGGQCARAREVKPEPLANT